MIFDYKGIVALSPLLLFIIIYLGLSIAAGDFYKIPITVAFTAASIYGIAITKDLPVDKRITLFSKGAGKPNLMLMIWIFTLRQNPWERLMKPSTLR